MNISKRAKLLKRSNNAYHHPFINFSAIAAMEDGIHYSTREGSDTKHPGIYQMFHVLEVELSELVKCAPISGYT